MPPLFDRVSEKEERDGLNVMRQKVSFLATLGILGLFGPKRAPGDATRIIFKYPRMLLFTPYYVVTLCKISQKYNGWLLRKVDTDRRKDGRTERIG